MITPTAASANWWCCDRGIEDEKLAEKPAVNGTPASDTIANKHGEGEERRAFSQAVEVLDSFASLFANDDQHRKTEQRHEQISDEIKADRDAGQ